MLVTHISSRRRTGPVSYLVQLDDTNINHEPQPDRRCQYTVQFGDITYNDAYWEKRKYGAEVTGESLSLDHDFGTVSDVHSGLEPRNDLQRRLKPRHL
jgi:hypothetical protein